MASDKAERLDFLSSLSKREEHSVGIDWMMLEIAKNLLMHIGPVVRLRKRFFARQNDPAVLIGDYFDFQWQTYRDALAGLNLRVDGSSILELGPGPILANGVRFIAEGAISYTALDRFDLLRCDAEVRRAYRELLGCLSPEQQQRCRGLLADANVARLFDERIQSIVSKIEDAQAKIGGRKWDLAVSFDVLEHVDDPAATLRSIRDLLKPGGVMIHRVDVGAHNVRADVHRLAHLTLSDRMWRLISSRRAICNRARPSEFLAFASDLGFETLRFEPTTMLVPEEIAAIRPNLWKRFAQSSFEDLAVVDFVWVARSSR